MNRYLVSPALGRVTSGIYVATSVMEGSPVGMLASFVEQAGFEPPMITIAVKPGRVLDKALECGGALGLNILGEKNRALVKPFGKSGIESPFANIEFSLHAGQAPRLHEAMAFLLCEPRAQVAGGDHRIYLCEVIDGIVQDEEDDPMVRIRQNGFGY